MSRPIRQAAWRRPNFGRALGLCALVVGMASWAVPAIGAPIRLAVPFRVDQTTTPSTMAVELEAEEMGGRPVTELTQATAHPSAAALQVLLGHLAAGQPQAAAAMLKPGAFQSPEDGQSYAGNFASSFQNAFPSAVVRRRYDVGSESWLSWEMTLDARPINRVSRFAEQGGQWYWADELRPGTLRSMQTLVSAAEQMLAENQAGARTVEGLTFRFAVPVPGMAARWLFNGFSTSWDAFGNGPVPDHPVTTRYAAAAKALHQGDFETFAAAHLPFSAQRLRESIAQMDDAQKAAFADSLRLQGRQVTFVLDAAPIFLVFYETDGRGLQYDTLFAPGGDLAKLQFCNFFFETFIDEIMKDRGFFHDPIIRPLAGRLEDPPAPTPAPAGSATRHPPADAAAQRAVQPLESGGATPAPGGIATWVSQVPAWGWLVLLFVLALLLFLFTRFSRSKP